MHRFQCGERIPERGLGKSVFMFKGLKVKSTFGVKFNCLLFFSFLSSEVVRSLTLLLNLCSGNF